MLIKTSKNQKRSSPKIELEKKSIWTDYLLFLNLEPVVDLGFEQVGFVYVEIVRKMRRDGREHTEEQHKMDALQEGIGADLREELQRVVDPIRSRVFFEVLQGV